MKALVTGGTGFVGGHLARSLLRDGAEVRVLARDERAGLDLAQEGAEVLGGDIRDAAACRSAVRDVEVVFHLAAVIGPVSLPSRVYRDTHVTGTRNLLEACLDRGAARFVHCSTASVIGPLRLLPASEEAPCNPANIYDRTKYEAECAVLDHHRRFGLPVTVIRPTWTYGPGDRRTMPLFRAISNRRFLLIGRRDTMIHPAYVDHVVQGLRLAAIQPTAVGRIYTIGDAEPTTVRALVQSIAQLLGTRVPEMHIPAWTACMAAALCEWAGWSFRFEPPLSRRRLQFFTRSAAFDISKARSQLGYEPTVPLEEGLRRTILWYKEQGYIPRS